MPSIEITEETNARLLRLVRSFNDSADDVIRRLLDSLEQSDHLAVTLEARMRGRRASAGSILPEGEYWLPLLEALVEADGELPANDAIEEVGRRLRGRLTTRDHESLEQGGVRWKNRTRFARLRMKEQGLLAADAPRGVWRITNEGRRYLARRGR